MRKARRPVRPGAASPPAPRERSPAAASSLPAAGHAWWRWALLVALVLAVYSPILHADFVNWDDPTDVYENPRVIAPDWFRRIWSDGSAPGFYPVLFIIYRLEWLAAAHQPWLFHLDSVLLHAGNALLVGALAGELGLPALASWFAAGLWALHPVQVESVAWITERKNVLYTGFWLAALLLYLRSRRAGARAPLLYAGALVLFVAALLSKGAAITLPAAFVLVEWGRGGRLDRRFWLGLLPAVALAVLGGFGLLGLIPSAIAVPPLGERLGVACRALWVYLATFLWPHALVPVYPKWAPAPAAPANLLAVLGVVVVGVMAWAARRRMPRVLVVGAALFATNIALVLGVVWNSYNDISFAADRYLYLPAVGLAVVAVAGVGELARAARLSPRIPAAVLAAWCAVLAVVTWRQVPVWRDSGTLWNYTLARNPDCLYCHESFGLLLMRRGDLDGAAEQYEAALRMGTRAEGALGLCSVRLQQRRVDEAATLCELGQRLSPTSPGAHRMFAGVLVRQHRLAEATEQYQTALRLALGGAGFVSDLASMVNDLAGVLLAQGRVGEAVRVLEEGIARLPEAAALPVSLSWIRATSADAAWRDGAQAVRLAERACALTANRDLDALDTLAAAYAEAGRFDDATRVARQALALVQAGSPRAGDVSARLALYEARQPYRE